MRVARTLQDVAELLCDYEVEIQLRDDCKIDFVFSFNQKEKDFENYTKENGPDRTDNFSHIPEKDPIHFRRKTIYTIRNLVSSPRFWRLTTVANQLGLFALSYKNRKETAYGSIQVRKNRHDKNLCMIFENMEFALLFIKNLEETKMFMSQEV